MNNVAGVVPISPVEKTWDPASTSTSVFSYSIWLRLPVSDLNENASGNVSILNLSGPPGQTKGIMLLKDSEDFFLLVRLPGPRLYRYGLLIYQTCAFDISSI